MDRIDAYFWAVLWEFLARDCWPLNPRKNGLLQSEDRTGMTTRSFSSESHSPGPGEKRWRYGSFLTLKCGNSTRLRVQPYRQMRATAFPTSSTMPGEITECASGCGESRTRSMQQESGQLWL